MKGAMMPEPQPCTYTVVTDTGLDGQPLVRHIVELNGCSYVFSDTDMLRAMARGKAYRRRKLFQLREQKRLADQSRQAELKEFHP